MHLPVSLLRAEPGPDPVLGDRTEHQTALEERINVGIHLTAMAMSLVGLAVLVALATQRGTALHVVAMVIYGGSMVALFLASSLYHGATSARMKPRLQVADHAAVFLLIAGSYTPFTLVTLQGALGWTLFAVVWFLALTGAAMQLYTAGRYRMWSVAHYVATGWVIVFAGPTLLDRLPLAAFGWLLAGGLAYTFGTVFYLANRVRFSHGVWHVMVVVGALCHWIAVLRFVLPGR
jgi:hemolysin III